LFYNDKNNEYTIFAWTHPTAAGKDIRYQKIALPAWIEQWPAGGWPVTEAKSDQILPQANREVFVWQDGRRDPIPYDLQDDENIYCQTPGDCTGPTQMNWRDVFARWAFGTDAREFRYVTNPEDGSTFVVWTEDRDPYNTPQSIVFIQKFDKDGVPRWSNNGEAVSPMNVYDLDAKLPDVCISDQGSAIVAYQRTSPVTGREECLATKFNAAGLQPWPAPALHGYTWSSAYTVLADSYTEPRILSSGNGNAVVAVLDSNSTNNVTFPHIFSVASNGANIPIGLINTATQTSVSDNHDLQFVFNGINAYYTITRSWSQPLIVCGAYDPSIIPLNPPFRYDAHAISFVGFDSYDVISRDYLLSPNFSELSFAYSIQSQAGGSYDVWVGRYGYVSGASTPPATYQVTMNMPYVDSKMPAIAADSVVNTQSGKQGVLLAWDTETHAPGYPITHRVESNRFKFPGAMQPEFLTHLILANGLSAPSHPDIARVIGTALLVSPAGVVVWEGGGELGPCTPARPTEIYGQYVIYDRSAPNPGPQWSQAELIAPGTGNYHQTRPMVDQSMPGGVAVFWYDGQTGNKSIMGTRLPELHTDIGWAKDRGKEVPAGTGTFSLGAVWPQPAQTLGAPVHVTIDAATGRTAVLELHDLLGRKVVTLFEGEVKDSGMLVRFTPAHYRLAPGVYLLRFSDGEKQQVKPITLIR
ncbi:MAG: hypothetical protein IH600_00220, partial [Bacteroidetes bacterium]|nr:hypothetical protein [Bacteroidota bacterium]